MTHPTSTVQETRDAQGGSSSSVDVKKRTHRRRKGLGFPRAAFSRLVKEIGHDFKSDMLWQPEAIQALQEASEHMLEQRFRKANKLAQLCKVDTITAAHFNGQAGGN